jgi:hypothetical protein
MGYQIWLPELATNFGSQIELATGIGYQNW